MGLTAEDVVRGIRQHGPRWAVVSIVSAIGLGVIDQFAGKVVPTIAQGIHDFIWPPYFTVRFPPPVDVSAGFTVSQIGPQGLTAVTASASLPELKFFTVHAGAGNYLLRLHGARERAGKELTNLMAIAASGQIWPVDDSERNWASEVALKAGGPPSSGPPGDASGAGAASTGRLSGTRWVLIEQDFAHVATIAEPPLRSILANALAEVGVYRQGDAWEQRRIAAYWAAAGPDAFNQPWGGAFMAWIVRQAGAQPPRAPQSFLNWRTWDDEVATDHLAPGMVGIFRLDIASEVPEAISRLLVGVIVRRQPSCIEIVAGNIAERVVVTCVATSALAGVRRPHL